MAAVRPPPPQIVAGLPPHLAPRGDGDGGAGEAMRLIARGGVRVDAPGAAADPIELPSPSIGGPAAGSGEGADGRECVRLVPAEASVVSSIVNLSNVVLGAGTLSMPFAFSQVGVAGGLTVLFVIYVVSVASAVMLTDTARLVRVRDLGGTYGALVRQLWGSRGTAITNFLVFAATYGASIGYFMLAGDLVAPPIGYWLGDDPSSYCSFWAKREGPMVCALALQCCLCTAPTMHMLRYVSLLAVVSMLYLTIIVVVRSGEDWHTGPDDGDEVLIFKFAAGIFRAVGICSFAFSPHIQMVPLFAELQQPTRPRTFTWLIVVLTLCLIVYSLVGTFGYVAFYGDTDGNLVLNFEPDDLAVTVGRLGVAVSVMCGYPMLMNPCVSALDALVFPNRGPSIWGRRLVWLAVCIGTTFAIALVVKDVSVVLGLTGASALTVSSVIIPACAYIYVFRARDGGACGSWMLVGAWAVLVVGLVCGTTSVAVTIADDIVGAEGEAPCRWPANWRELGCDPGRCCTATGGYDPPLSANAVCPPAPRR